MGVKVFKNEEGTVMVQGIPSGYWVFVTFGVLIMMIGLLVTFTGGFISGLITSFIGLVILLSGKAYGNSKRNKKVKEYYLKQKTEDLQSRK